MIRKIHAIFTAVAAVTSITFLHVQGMLDGSVVDGILISAIFVTFCSAIAGIASWIITSIIITKNKSQTITVSNFLAGALSGFIMAATLSGWGGAMYGLVLGAIAGTSCCAVFTLKNRKALDDMSVINITIRGMVWYATIYIPFSLWQHHIIVSSFWS